MRRIANARPFLPALVLGLSLLLYPQICLGHGEGPPPTPPPISRPHHIDTGPTAAPTPRPTGPEIKTIPGTPAELTAPAVVYVAPARWSWIHWWEANRDQYLRSARQGRGQKPDQQALDAHRKKATDALMDALKSDMAPWRQWAAVALGELGHVDAIPALGKLMAEDKDPDVRMAAAVALGLLNKPAAEKLLLETNFRTALDKQAAICGVVLEGDPGAAAPGTMGRMVADANTDLCQPSSWWLRLHSDVVEPKKLADLVMTHRDPRLVSEAILAQGRQGKTEVVAKLAEMLRAEVGADLDAHSKRLPAAWWDLELQHVTLVRRAKTPAAIGQSITIGIQAIYLSRLKGSAAIAMGDIDCPESRAALIAALRAPDDDYSDVYKEFAIISLGKLGDKEGMGLLVDILRRGHCSKTNDLRPESALRGFAAVALGLYARPIVTVQGTNDRPDYDKVCQLLGERMADAKETAEVRSACEIALGLTGRTENLKHLQPASKSVGNDDMLVGFTFLARGLLGDNNIIGPAKTYLAKDRDKDDLAGVMGRRAAVTGLGCLGTQESIPILLDAWHLSYHVNQEATPALAMCQAYNVTDDLLKLMKESKNPWEKAFAARALGELLAPTHPQRATALLEGSNYTLRNEWAFRYQALGNEFMYLFLLPAFGGDWR